MIKKGVKVKVLIGKDRKKEGEVIEIDRSNNRAKVKGLNLVKKHMKTTKEKKGGIVTKENFITILPVSASNTNNSYKYSFESSDLEDDFQVLDNEFRIFLVPITPTS